MLAVDTKVLVRLITNDDPKQGLRAQQALDAELEAGRECSGDIADHLIGAQMQSLGCEAVLTFDKRASKSDTHRAV